MENIVNKTTIKAFIAWLESASYEEIQEHKNSVQKTLTYISSVEGKSDVRLALRLIDEEILARLELDMIALSKKESL